MRKILSAAAWAVIIWLCTGCTTSEKHYVIGVSQCSKDIWRDKQNAELRMGTFFNEGVELRFAAAYDSDERQIEQIDSLLDSGIQLLIVAPNQVATISPAIDRAYDRGIPVIVFERKTNSQKYTAFMSADNYEMGHQMGQYIATRLKGHGQMVEVMGLKGSSPAIERHKGFVDAIAAYPNLKVVATLQGDWTEETAYEKTLEWRQQHPDVAVDLVFGMNDRSATGARKAFLEVNKSDSQQPLYCGIDGLPGKDGGIRLVRDSILEASYIYPTYGDRLLQLAIDILDGKPYQKEIRMQSALVTHDNANVLLMQTDETLRQGAYLEQLHEKADNYLHKLDTQRAITWLACGVIVLLLVVIVLLYLYHLGKVNMRRERVVNTLWNLKSEDIATEELTTGSQQQKADGKEPTANGRQLTAGSEETTADNQEATADSQETTGDNPEPSTSYFIARFKEVVEASLENSELSVEDLAASMNLSRVQLYRKVKNITGSTPVELLRTARLNRSYQLLLTTDRSVSEIAYQVGFTAPSYFTKCFKEAYGMLPGEVHTQ